MEISLSAAIGQSDSEYVYLSGGNNPTPQISPAIDGLTFTGVALPSDAPPEATAAFLLNWTPTAESTAAVAALIENACDSESIQVSLEGLPGVDPCLSSDLSIDNVANHTNGYAVLIKQPENDLDPIVQWQASGGTGPYTWSFDTTGAEYSAATAALWSIDGQGVHRWLTPPDFETPQDSEEVINGTQWLRDNGYWGRVIVEDAEGCQATMVVKVEVEDVNETVPNGDRVPTLSNLTPLDCDFQRLMGAAILPIGDLINHNLNGTHWAHRIMAEDSGDIESLHPFWIATQNGGGYSNGTGGTIRARVWPVDGAGMPIRSGTPLAEGQLVAGLVNGSFAGGGIAALNTPMPMTSNQALVESEVYVVEYDNLDPNPSQNFLAVDDFLDRSQNAQGSPYMDPAVFNVLRSNNGGTTWTEQNNAANDYRSPNLWIKLTNGSTFGRMRGESGAKVGRVPPIDATNWVASRYTNPCARSLVGSDHLMSFITPGSVKVQILAADGTTVLDEQTITESTANYQTYVDVGTTRVGYERYELNWSTPLPAGTFYVRYLPQGSTVIHLLPSRDLERPGWPESEPSSAMRWDGSNLDYFYYWDQTNWDSPGDTCFWSDAVHMDDCC